MRTRVPSEISPDASGCAACPKPRDHSDTARQPRESPPEDPPGHSASAPRVDHPGSEPSVYYRKFQKMVVTSKIHKNSSLNRKKIPNQFSRLAFDKI